MSLAGLNTINMEATHFLGTDVISRLEIQQGMNLEVTYILRTDVIQLKCS